MLWESNGKIIIINVMVMGNILRKVIDFLEKKSKADCRHEDIRYKFDFNSQAPVAQKIADEVAFRRFQGEGVEFF